MKPDENTAGEPADANPNAGAAPLPEELDPPTAAGQAAPMIQPSVGRIVHTIGSFAQADGQPYAAIITKIHNRQIVDLHIFDHGQGPGDLFQAVLGQDWAWPPRV